MKKKILILTLLLLTTGLLCGCGDKKEKEIEKVETEIVKTQYDNMSYIVDKTYKKTNSNVLYSPLSLDMAFGMTSTGAVGETKIQIDNYLGNDNYAEFAKEYNNKIKKVQGIEIANSVWIDDEVEDVKIKIKEDFKNNAKKQFNADVKDVDFEDKSNSVKDINKWAKKKTHGLIPTIIDENSIQDETQSILVNSLYFRSAWSKEFEVSEGDLTFTKFDKTEQNVDKLYTKEHIYYENDKVTAFSKSYKNGIKFIGILPKEEGEFNVSDLDIEKLLKTKTYEYDVYIEMPKLNYESEVVGLKETLEELGIKNMFKFETAQFDGIAELRNDDEVQEVIYFSDVIQKCKIELNEKETKASAISTALGNFTQFGAAEEELKEVILNRPFVYLIYDEENDQVLFIGKVVDVK